MSDTNASSWEEWGQVDPLWAIVTHDSKRAGRWDIDEFFESGRKHINALWTRVAAHELPRQRAKGLDFGCGVGRLTRALGDHVDDVLGLDIAPSMISLARDYNAAFDHLRFEVHPGWDLSDYQNDTFDVVCCLLVLQHLPSHAAIRRYVQEFVRVLAPGGAMLLQLPDHVPAAPPIVGFKAHLRPRTRLARGLHKVGVSPKFLYDHLRWTPEMTMRGLPADEVQMLVTTADGRIVWTSDPLVEPSGVRNLTYLITC